MCHHGSVGSPHVRVGHRQAHLLNTPDPQRLGVFALGRIKGKGNGEERAREEREEEQRSQRSVHHSATPPQATPTSALPLERRGA